MSNAHMDEKKTHLAILVSILFVMVYTELFIAPHTRPPTKVVYKNGAQVNAVQQSGTKPVKAYVPDAPVSPPSKDLLTQNQNAASASQANTPVATTPVDRFPNPAEINASKSIEILTDKMRVRLILLGGRISSLKLKDYKTAVDAETALDMVSVRENDPLPLGVNIGGVNDSFVEYAITGITEQTELKPGVYSVPADNPFRVVLSGTLPNGTQITKTLSFRTGTYLFDVDVSVSAPANDGSSLWLGWGVFENANAERDQFDVSGFVYLDSTQKVNSIATPSIEKEGLSDGTSVQWMGFANKYFLSALVPTESSSKSNVRYGRVDNFFIARVKGDTTSGSFKAYIGPKVFEDLEQTGLDLQRSIDLGWFSFLAHPLLGLIKFFFKIFGNYGLAIILLTLVIKAAFLPLTRKSFESMAAMQEIQPEVKALRERIKDPNQLNTEMLALYKKRGVNPMGGCLPVLIQLPVFLGLYNALLYSIELRHAPFALWITDLSAPESLVVGGIGIPVMVLLMGLSMLVSQWTTPSTMDPVQKKVMLFMPVVFTFLFLGFPSGLVLYWLINNVISIVQQMYIRSERKATPTQATLVASVAIFSFGFILTLM